MLKTFAGALAVAGAALFVAPSAQAASVDGVSALTQELSAQTVSDKAGRRAQEREHSVRTVMRTPRPTLAVLLRLLRPDLL